MHRTIPLDSLESDSFGCPEEYCVVNILLNKNRNKKEEEEKTRTKQK